MAFPRDGEGNHPMGIIESGQGNAIVAGHEEEGGLPPTFAAATTCNT